MMAVANSVFSVNSDSRAKTRNQKSYIVSKILTPMSIGLTVLVTFALCSWLLTKTSDGNMVPL